jgi:hypothetical protein
MTAIEAMTGAVADEIFGKGFALSEARRDFCLKVARAALIALRDCQLHVDTILAGVNSGPARDPHELVTLVFRAMLDAAIKEG